ncbi:MAG: phytoene synthase [Alphaproteobacteria bacterium]|nr:phytoene synthase [Alphaproteobacteria bacterium]
MLGKNYLSIYAKSFNWAGFFLPKDTYKECSALYDFCRTVDNLADEKNELKTREQKFQEFNEDFKNKNFNNIVIKNMWNLIDKFNISLKIIEDLFEGIKSDIKDIVKINSKKDLIIYSYKVAGTVGLMMAKVLRVKKKNALKSAIDLGIAMQLTNISRDVIEDKKSNRAYIDYDFESIKSTIKLSNLFYDSSFLAIKEIPLNLRFSILVARRVYKKIGHKIIAKNNIENYEKSGKIYLTNFEKFVETFLSIFDFIILLFNYKSLEKIAHNYDLINEEINLNERI